MSLIAIAKKTQIVAAVASIALARKRAEHVPAAVALVVLTAVGLARGPLRAALAPLHRPIEGTARALVYAARRSLPCTRPSPGLLSRWQRRGGGAGRRGVAPPGSYTFMPRQPWCR